MTRINKTSARKLFKDGKQFWMVPCNLRPEYGILINSVGREYSNETFDKVVNSFVYYNCNHETGYYPAYYTEA